MEPTLSIDEINRAGPDLAYALSEMGRRRSWTNADLVAIVTSALVEICRNAGGPVNAVEYLRDIADDYERQIMRGV